MPYRPLSLLAAALAALAVVAGCEAERIPAAVACNTACTHAAACGEADCFDRCMATSSDLEIFASCSACITGAGADCELRATCLSTCDGRALASPECGTLCAGVVSDCAGAADCMDRCVALDEQSRSLCLQCVSVHEDECAAWSQCADCSGAGVPAG